MIRTESDSERYVFWYLEELKERGFIEHIERGSQFDLSEAVYGEFIITITKGRKPNKVEVQVLDKKMVLEPHIYTGDFRVIWNEKAKGIFIPKDDNFKKYPFLDDKLISEIEVKPKFDFNNMTRAFRINQKWVYQKHKVIICLVNPEDLFKKTFTPNRYLLTDKTLKPRKINREVRTLEEYLKLKEND